MNKKNDLQPVLLSALFVLFLTEFAYAETPASQEQIKHPQYHYFLEYDNDPACKDFVAVYDHILNEHINRILQRGPASREDLDNDGYYADDETTDYERWKSIEFSAAGFKSPSTAIWDDNLYKIDLFNDGKMRFVYFLRHQQGKDVIWNALLLKSDFKPVEGEPVIKSTSSPEDSNYFEPSSDNNIERNIGLLGLLESKKERPDQVYFFDKLPGYQEFKKNTKNGTYKNWFPEVDAQASLGVFTRDNQVYFILNNYKWLNYQVFQNRGGVNSYVLVYRVIPSGFTDLCYLHMKKEDNHD